MNLSSSDSTAASSKKTPLRLAADQIVRHLQKNGHIALYAGGWVRDFVMGKEGEDIDIATSASPQEVLAIFPKSIPVGASFGVVRVLVEGYQFEVATFRSDGSYSDGRHPDSVSLTLSPQEDAQRRDFTVNGLFFDPSTSEVLDFVGGIQDIRKKIIRTIGSPDERFQEDRLRIIRAIRFKNTLGFSIEESTWNAIKKYTPTTVAAISPERIWQEIQKMHQKGVLATCLRDMRACGLLHYIFPPCREMGDEFLDQRLTAIDISTSQHPAIMAALHLSLLYPAETIAARDELFHQYRLSTNERHALNTVTRIEKALRNIQPSDSERQRVSLYALPHAESSLLVLSSLPDLQPGLCETMRKESQALSFWIRQLQEKRFFVTGQDFVDRGFPKGKRIGDLVEKAFSLSLATKEKDKESILRAVLSSERPSSS